MNSEYACSRNITQESCKDSKNNCLWLEDGHPTLWANTLEKKICVDADKYNKVKNDVYPYTEWNDFVVNAHKNKEITKSEQSQTQSQVTVPVPVPIEEPKTNKDAIQSRPFGSRHMLYELGNKLETIKAKSTNQTGGFYNYTNIKQQYIMLKSQY